MKVYKTVLISCFIFFAIHLYAYDIKYAGAGLSASAVKGYSPGAAFTPYVLYRIGDNEMIGGPQFYSGMNGFGSIVGIEGEYKRYYLNFSRHFSGCFFYDFQYVRFATGPVRDIPFKYHKSIVPGLDYSMFQFRSFENILGASIYYHFLGNFSVFFEAGVNNNYSVSDYSPYNVNHTNMDQFTPGKKITWGYMLKFGLDIVLWHRKRPVLIIGDF